MRGFCRIQEDCGDSIANEEKEDVGSFEPQSERLIEGRQRLDDKDGKGPQEAASTNAWIIVVPPSCKEPNCHTVDIVCKEPACHTADELPRGPPPNRRNVRKLRLRSAITDVTFVLQFLLLIAIFADILG